MRKIVTATVLAIVLAAVGLRAETVRLANSNGYWAALENPWTAGSNIQTGNLSFSGWGANCNTGTALYYSIWEYHDGWLGQIDADIYDVQRDDVQSYLAQNNFCTTSDDYLGYLIVPWDQSTGFRQFYIVAYDANGYVQLAQTVNVTN